MEESSGNAAEGDDMVGTSKFGGSVNDVGVYDSFDDAFEKADESRPLETDDYVVKPKPRRPQWGVQSFGAHDGNESRQDESDAADNVND